MGDKSSVLGTSHKDITNKITSNGKVYLKKGDNIYRIQKSGNKYHKISKLRNGTWANTKNYSYPLNILLTAEKLNKNYTVIDEKDIVNLPQNKAPQNPSTLLGSIGQNENREELKSTGPPYYFRITRGEFSAIYRSNQFPKPGETIPAQGLQVEGGPFWIKADIDVDIPSIDDPLSGRIDMIMCEEAPMKGGRRTRRHRRQKKHRKTRRV